MKLDASTIAFAGGLVSFASGCFLFLHWFHTREDREALAWGATNCTMGIGVAILALHDVRLDVFSTVIGPLLLGVSSVGVWAASRVFNRGSIAWRDLLIVLGLVLTAPMVIGASGHERISTVCGMTLTALLYASGAREFWLARRERLRGRWTMISLLSLRAFALFLMAIGTWFAEVFSELPTIGWFGIIDFVVLVYAAGSATSLVTMLKDRSEIKHIAAALMDPLTGIPNRRAFMDRAQRIVDRNLRDEAPVSLLAFDLDRFKKINDTFGHPTGDRVLRIFADVLSRVARPTDAVGRVGGEEFLLALPGCTHDAALAVAARIRGAFQNEAHFVDGQVVAATVSVGVATAPEHGATLEELIARSDGALYRAKDLGRNRVVGAGIAHPGPSRGVVTRIA